ncbi:hypothetical protein AB0M95_40635 [Sphaerisporangium sp. NPDC051017]|uniref:hypothetical protein n=1 Tax=Sphaerisporangium sp. NPDC051017 TaxID=3154636 RepID=UPI003434C63D
MPFPAAGAVYGDGVYLTSTSTAADPHEPVCAQGLDPACDDWRRTWRDNGLSDLPETGVVFHIELNGSGLLETLHNGLTACQNLVVLTYTEGFTPHVDLARRHPGQPL